LTGVPSENGRKHQGSWSWAEFKPGTSRIIIKKSVNSTEKFGETLGRSVPNLNRIYEEVELLHYL
jgi:hypothetical protein